MKKFTALVNMSPIVRTAYGAIASFYAQYDTSDEHRKWAQATPAANFTLNVSNEFADDMEPGQYIVTFEKVEKPI